MAVLVLGSFSDFIQTIGPTRTVILSVGVSLVLFFLIFFITDWLRLYFRRMAFEEGQRRERLKESGRNVLRAAQSDWERASDEDKEKLVQFGKKALNHAASATSIRDFLKRVSDDKEPEKKGPPDLWT